MRPFRELGAPCTYSQRLPAEGAVADDIGAYVNGSFVVLIVKAYSVKESHSLRLLGSGVTGRKRVW